MRTVLAAVAFICWSCDAAGDVRSLRVSEPRPFGLFIGDVIERRAEIAVDAEDELVAASLPKAGPVTYWLELRSIDVGEGFGDGARRYTVDLSYQTFYAPFEAKRIAIPPVILKIRSGGSTQTATIPEFAFVASPIRELFSSGSDSSSAVALRSDAAVTHVPTGNIRTALAVFGTGGLVSLGLLAHHLAWWPFRRRPGRPFTEAARKIRGAEGAGGSAQGYRDGLVHLHRAFDELAGQRVLAGDLPRFMAGHPAFEKYRTEIDLFFDGSRRVFFADDLSGGMAVFPPHALRALAGDLAHLEQVS